jgi:hypothetical protein
MRLARLAVVGLGIGVFTGFCAALLKPRRPALPAEPSAQPAGPPAVPAEPRRTLDATALETRDEIPGRVV